MYSKQEPLKLQKFAGTCFGEFITPPLMLLPGNSISRQHDQDHASYQIPRVHLLE
jgi:hypothetical protein